jgi:Major Facilitator Superfamily
MSDDPTDVPPRAPGSTSAIRRRYLALLALRWFPVGLVLPVFVLIPLDRGLGLAELGIVLSLQGFVVLALELPTGGLADSVGRRRVLLAASVVGIASMALFLVAEQFIAFALVFILQGIHRALDSGPLEAWFVDETLAIDPDASIDSGLSAAGVVLGVSIAIGALLSGLLVAIDPIPGIDALAVPVALSVAIQVAALAAIVVLMTETRVPGGAGFVGTARAVPTVVADGLRLLRHSRVLSAIVAVELTWGFGMVAFESLFPLRLEDLLGSADAAASVAGPAGSAAWLVSAAGAAAMPWIGRRIGIAPTAALLRIVQALTVVGIGLAFGLAGALIAYMACYLVHGASGPAHMTLLHRQAGEAVRATVVSLDSMAGQTAGAIGIIALTAIASASSLTTAFLVGAIALALGAPLYLPAWRQEQSMRTLRQVEATGPGST